MGKHAYFHRPHPGDKADKGAIESALRFLREAGAIECRREGLDPEKPFSGKVTLRLPPVLHRRVAIKAASRKESMNQYLEDLIARDTASLNA